VLLPIAHVTTLAGSVTLIGTSSNLVIAGIAGEHGVDMGMLSFAAVALPVALVGAVVIYLTSPRALRGAADTAPRNKATEEGIAAIWRTPLFGMSAERLYAVSISAGEPASLHDFERDGSLRIIAARSDRPLHETDLNPGETCYVSGENEEAVARNPAVALCQAATSRAPQPSKTFVALGVLLCVIVAGSFGLVPAEVAASSGAVLMVLTGVITPAFRRPRARAEGPRPARGIDRPWCDCRRERPRRRDRRRDLRHLERDAWPRDRARRRDHCDDEPSHQRGYSGDRHARRSSHRGGHGRRPCDRPRAGRQLRLLYADQSL